MFKWHPFRALDHGTNETQIDFWKDYNIRVCLNIIKDEWNYVEEHTMNSYWQNLCPDFVNYFKGFPIIDNGVQDIRCASELGRKGFDDPNKTT